MYQDNVRKELYDAFIEISSLKPKDIISIKADVNCIEIKTHGKTFVLTIHEEEELNNSTDHLNAYDYV